MLLGEPAPTQFDINFSILGVPVRVHPLFFLGVLLFGGIKNLANPTWLAIFGVTLFLSVLGHELGHVMAFGYYGIRSRVVLMLFGGLAIPDSGMGSGIWSNFGGYTNNRRNTQGWGQVVISGAGPAANFVMALVVAIAANLAGISVTFHLNQGLEVWSVVTNNAALGNLVLFIMAMLYVNTYLGLLNLLPIIPMDGGQISRALFVMADPWRGLNNSLWLSCITGGAMAVWMLTQGDQFLAIWFGVLGFGAFQQLQGGFGGRRPW